MTRTHFPHLFLCITILMLTSCAFEYSHGSMDTLYPNAKKAQNNAALGLHFLHTGDTDQAMEKLQLAMQENPRDPLIIGSLAYFYEKTGEAERANRLFIYAITMAPESARANQNYAAFLCRNGYYRESIRYFSFAAHTTNNPHAQTALSDSQFCTQEMQRALGEKATWAYHMSHSDNN